MNGTSNRNWLVIAGVVLLVMVALWVLAVFQLKPAAAGGSRIALSLRSGLGADYSADQGQTLASLSLSIVSDMMEDLGMGPLVAAEYSDDMRIALLTPVPTATALNFEGDPPPSPSPSHTPVPSRTASSTPTETPNPTSTRRPTSTNTPVPTKTGPTAKPVTVAPCPDCKKPSILGANLSPSGGDLGSCLSPTTISINDMHVVDPETSSGMDFVGVKYKFNISGGNYVFVELSKTSGGWDGNEWDAYYSGNLTIEWTRRFGVLPVNGKILAKAMAVGETDTPTATSTADPPTATPTPTETPIPTDTNTPSPTVFSIEVYGKAEDNAGNISYLSFGTFSCTN